MIISHTYTSLKPWKKLLITWAVHGTEPCWPIAISRITDEIEKWLLEIIQWSVTFIPVCNPEWFKKNLRLIEENLARIFDKYDNPTTYERKCSTVIAPYIDNCDALLDIHSGNAKDSKFVFLDHATDENVKITHNLWFDIIIQGWPDMYPDDWAKDPSSYAYNQWKPWIVVECGQHQDPEAPLIAYNAIKDFLHHYWLIAEWWNNTPASIHHIMMKKMVYMQDKQWIFIKERKNWDTIKKWDIIAIYDDGEKVFSDIDGYIVLPKHWAKPWGERFYLAQQI
jgi:uncharacterized protein